MIPANIVTNTEALKLIWPFFLEVLFKSLLRYGMVWPLGTVMSSTHPLNVGQAEVIQEIFNFGHYLQLLYVCSSVSNSETQLVSVQLFTLPER